MTVPCLTRRGPVDLTDLQPSDLTATELADAMAKINRFAGRTPEPWSVAAHSVLVEALVPPDMKAWAILHDAHKVFLGDLTDPAVEFLCQYGTRTSVEHAILNAEAQLDRRIAAAWGVVPRPKSAGLMLACQAAFLAEAWVLMEALPPRLGAEETDLFDRAVSFLRANHELSAWRTARDRWLSRVDFLAAAGLLAPPRMSDPSSAPLAG